MNAMTTKMTLSLVGVGLVAVVALGLGLCGDRSAKPPSQFPSVATSPGLTSAQPEDSSPAGRAVQLSVGDYHACAVLTNQSVRCVGLDEDGQSSPPATLEGVKYVSVGSFHSCAVVNNGSVECWGSDWTGQSSPPSRIEAMGLAAGRYQTCALLKDRSVTCWGDQGSRSATPPALKGVAELSAGLRHMCARLDSGSVRCWGNDAVGQSSPPSDLGEALDIDAGRDVSCAVTRSGEVRCWGKFNRKQNLMRSWTISGSAKPKTVSVNYDWQLYSVLTDGSVAALDPADHLSESRLLKVPARLEGRFERAEFVEVGKFAACGLDRGGRVVCWSEASDQEGKPLVDGSWEWPWRLATESDAEEPKPPVGNVRLRASQVSAGETHSCALIDDGSVHCWAGAASEAYFPPGDLRATQISAGATSSCAIRTSDRSVQCWNPPSVRPVTATQVSTNGTHHCAVLTNGKVDCWGAETWSPANPTAATYVNSGPALCAAFADGRAVCWKHAEHKVPADLRGVEQIATDRVRACVLLQGGQVQCWGGDAPGASGMPNIRSATQISAGGYHTCAVLKDRTLKCWGPNDGEDFVDFGQAVVPTGLKDVVQVSAGETHTCVVTGDGGVLCWGYTPPGPAEVPTRLRASFPRRQAIVPERLRPREH
jgi:alpha-tubulin suppressor-like RCC1 family protein